MLQGTPGGDHSILPDAGLFILYNESDTPGRNRAEKANSLQNNTDDQP
jgi:hypothetical protein